MIVVSVKVSPDLEAWIEGTGIELAEMYGESKPWTRSRTVRYLLEQQAYGTKDALSTSIATGVGAEIRQRMARVWERVREVVAEELGDLGDDDGDSTLAGVEETTGRRRRRGKRGGRR